MSFSDFDFDAGTLLIGFVFSDRVGLAFSDTVGSTGTVLELADFFRRNLDQENQRAFFWASDRMVSGDFWSEVLSE